ncbi:MAG: hypothetical protein ACRECZ_03735 [Methylocella sp.]
MTFPPEWHALGREAELAAEQLAIGVTALGRANHAQKGLYNQAFFGLSIGFERLAKLILVADHAVENNGAWMTGQALKSIGHDISALLDVCEPISAKHLASKKWCERPNEPIHKAIVRTLSEFARLTRYYNLASLGGGTAANWREPIQAWWSDVGMPILDHHYSANQRAKDEAQAAMIGGLLSPAFVLHHDEACQPMSSVEAMMVRAGSTRVIQKYGRLYVKQLIRWLSVIMREIISRGGRIEPLFGLDEPFSIFRMEDRWLLSHKTWSIYRQ